MISTPQSSLLALTAAASLVVPVALGQQAQPGAPAVSAAQGGGTSSDDFTKADPTYKFRFEPSLWYVAMSGEVRMPGSPGGVDRPKLGNVGADKPRIAPLGEVHVAFSNWRVSLSGFGTSANTTGVATKAGQFGAFAFNAGDTVRTSIDFATAELIGGYSFGPWAAKPLTTESKSSFSFDATVLVGVRLYDLSLGFGSTAADLATTNQFFAEPLIGGRAEMEFAHGFGIDVQSTFGAMPGSHSTASWEIEAGFVYRPVEHVGIRLGYRNIRFNLSTGSDGDKFQYNGGAAGLFGGVELRF